MAARVAYGPRENIQGAINNGVIPKDTIIITSDPTESELLFHDSSGAIRNIAERTRFNSKAEAEAWTKKYASSGLILSVHEQDVWVPYVVNDDGALIPFESGGGGVTIIERLDGGTASGI